MNGLGLGLIDNVPNTSGPVCFSHACVDATLFFHLYNLCSLSNLNMKFEYFSLILLSLSAPVPAALGEALFEAVANNKRMAMLTVGAIPALVFGLTMKSMKHDKDKNDLAAAHSGSNSTTSAAVTTPHSATTTSAPPLPIDPPSIPGQVNPNIDPQESQLIPAAKESLNLRNQMVKIAHLNHNNA